MGINVFAGLPTYGEGWSVKSSRNFNAEECAAVKSASVVTSDYGLSVCFLLNAGGMKYIPVSRDCGLTEGEVITNLAEHKIVTLSQSGKEDIVRFE